MLRFVVELDAAALAVRNANREDEVRLTLACDAFQKAANAKDFAAFIAADREFHITLVRASHDNMLIRIYDFLQATLFRRETVLREFFSGPHLATQKAHGAILKAFLDRDARKLQKLLKRHLNYIGLRPRLEEFATPIQPPAPESEC